MAEHFLKLSPADRADALEAAALSSGRPADLLEKDVWVVWALNVLFRSPFGGDLCFKGGTSLSKGYGVIDRFSEDVDLTYDIRAVIPDLAGDAPDPLPPSRSQERKRTKAVRAALREWVDSTARAAIERQVEQADLPLELSSDGESLRLSYERVTETFTDYVASEVLLEFGARSTGEPLNELPVRCDAEEHLADLTFPTATPRLMAAERTFWEKATAIHVYCLQGRVRGDRYARHWYDLIQLDDHGIADRALGDRALAKTVAVHKSWFFREKTADGDAVDYEAAVSGGLHLVPEGDSLELLGDDYSRMLSAGLLPEGALSFEAIVEGCRSIAERANGLRGS